MAGSDVADGSLLGADFKAGELPAGPVGPQGPAGLDGAAGPQGPAGATNVVARRAAINVAAPPAGTSTIRLGSASCEAGEIAVGGGAGITNIQNGHSIVFGGEPLESDGTTPETGEVATKWRAVGVNANPSSAQTMTVQVLCATP
ncbi:MAG: hypothetical protein ACRDPC_11450 [Solirubrobacteraceae bacterium]